MTERRRRFLFVSGLAVVASSVCSPSPRRRPVRATTPPTPTLPRRPPRRRRRPRRRRPRRRRPTRRRRPRRRGDHGCRRATTRRRPTTSLLPTTTTEAPEPARRRSCIAANAECDPATGETTVSWKVTNNGDAPVTITENTEDAPLEPNPVPPVGEMATATQVIEGPATDQQVTSTVTIDVGGGVVIEESDDITAGRLRGAGTPAGRHVHLHRRGERAVGCCWPDRRVHVLRHEHEHDPVDGRAARR